MNLVNKHTVGIHARVSIYRPLTPWVGAPQTIWANRFALLDNLLSLHILNQKRSYITAIAIDAIEEAA